jgi:prepilin-type N-terminal cleavage/methylation domain-containing protein
MKKYAFTLAEVLITLGIIGIVASLTIPTLMKNQERAELRSGFLKANLLVNTVVNSIVQDKGITELHSEYCYQNNDSCKSGIYTGMGSVQKLAYDMEPYLKYQDYLVANPVTSKRSKYDTRKSINNIKGEIWSWATNYMPEYPTFDLNDGSIINVVCFSNAWPEIAVDTNGNKPPNRFGYDIFFWRLQGRKAIPTSDNYSDGQNCALTSGNYSGVMCGQYAITNKCPWDDTKTYWECLP